MGSRIGKRVIHFANLPIKLLPPKATTNIKEISLKTIPSASKFEIKRLLESLYGFDVEKVETLNMEGKKKKWGGVLLARPDYKKAYVTLRTPLSVSPDWFPIKVLEEEKERKNQREREASVVEEKKSHWLEWKKEEPKKGRWQPGRRENRPGPSTASEPVKFPWSNMKATAR